MNFEKFRTQLENLRHKPCAELTPLSVAGVKIYIESSLPFADAQIIPCHLHRLRYTHLSMVSTLPQCHLGVFTDRSQEGSGSLCFGGVPMNPGKHKESVLMLL